jgi:hypothetical protein
MAADPNLSALPRHQNRPFLLYAMSGGLNLVRGGAGGGGEYATQVGFGWTNGVMRALGSSYPKLSSLSPELCEASHAAHGKVGPADIVRRRK